MVFIFSLTATLLSADQNLLAPNLSTIAEEFHMDDDARDQLLGGAISSGFFAVGAPSALLIGWLSDRMDRRWLLFIVVILGSQIFHCIPPHSCARAWKGWDMCILNVDLNNRVDFSCDQPMRLSTVDP